MPLPRRLLRAAGDERLVDQLRRGNEAAFETMYERYHRPLLGYCRHLVGSASEAEDAIQQVFAAAYRTLRKPDRELELRPWLYAIARNTCISHLRRRRAECAEAVAPARSSAHEAEARAEVLALVSDIAALPENQRSALVLSELADLAHDEIAAVVGCERAKVKSLIHQARQRLLERRKARDTSCTEVRDMLSTLRGGSLRRAWLQIHLRGCPGCREYHGEIKRRRGLIALTIPVPSAGLRDSVLAATSGGGAAGGGGAGAGGIAAGAGAQSAGGTAGAATAAGGATTAGASAGAGLLPLASPVIAKAAIGLALAGGATAGGLAIQREHAPGDARDRREQATRGAEDSASSADEATNEGRSGTSAEASELTGSSGTAASSGSTREDTARFDATESEESEEPAGEEAQPTEDQEEDATQEEENETEPSAEPSRRSDRAEQAPSGGPSAAEPRPTAGAEVEGEPVGTRLKVRRRGQLGRSADEGPVEPVELP